MFKAGFELVLGVFFGLLFIILMLICLKVLIATDYSIIGVIFERIKNLFKVYWLFIVPAIITLMIVPIGIISALFGNCEVS